MRWCSASCQALPSTPSTHIHLPRGGPPQPTCVPERKALPTACRVEASLNKEKNTLESQALDHDFNVRQRGCKGVSPRLGWDLWE